MKKQLILSTLIISLSCSQANCTSDISEHRKLESKVLAIAKNYGFNLLNKKVNREKIDTDLKNKKQLYKKICIIDKFLLGAATTAMIIATYLCWTKQFDTLLEKKSFTVIATGLSLLSYGNIKIMQKCVAVDRIIKEPTLNDIKTKIPTNKDTKKKKEELQVIDNYLNLVKRLETQKWKYADFSPKHTIAGHFFAFNAIIPWALPPLLACLKDLSVCAKS